MYRFFQGIPRELLQSAQLDGANSLQILWYIGIPLGGGGIMSAMVLSFLEYWNMVEQPMLFLKDDGLKTLSVFITNAQEYTGEVLFPAAVIFLIPMLILYLFFNENLEKGLTLGDLS